MSVSKSTKEKIQRYVNGYYESNMNIVQVYPDPKVHNCYVVRFEDEQGNWCCVLNFDYENEPMIEDGVDLEDGQKITKRMFGELRFF